MEVSELDPFPRLPFALSLQLDRPPLPWKLEHRPPELPARSIASPARAPSRAACSSSAGARQGQKRARHRSAVRPSARPPFPPSPFPSKTAQQGARERARGETHGKRIGDVDRRTVVLAEQDAEHALLGRRRRAGGVVDDREEHERVDDAGWAGHEGAASAGEKEGSEGEGEGTQHVGPGEGGDLGRARGRGERGRVSSEGGGEGLSSWAGGGSLQRRQDGPRLTRRPSRASRGQGGAVGRAVCGCGWWAEREGEGDDGQGGGERCSRCVEGTRGSTPASSPDGDLARLLLRAPSGGCSLVAASLSPCRLSPKPSLPPSQPAHPPPARERPPRRQHVHLALGRPHQRSRRPLPGRVRHARLFAPQPRRRARTRRRRARRPRARAQGRQAVSPPLCCCFLTGWLAAWCFASWRGVSA